MLKRICTIALLSTVAATITMFAAALSAAEESKDANLPLKRVVLFNSGVGFFEHSGKVDGNANVELKFKTDQINDLLRAWWCKISTAVGYPRSITVRKIRSPKR